MVESGQAVRSAHGLYRIEQIPRDDLDVYMFAALWPRGSGVISHTSASVLHRINDANPVVIDVTVPRSFRTSMAWPEKFRPHRADLREEMIGFVEGVPVVRPFWCIKQMIEGQAPLGLIRQSADRARRDALITFEQQAELVADMNRLADVG